MTAKTEHLGQDSRDRSIWTGQPREISLTGPRGNCENMTVRTRQPGQERRDKKTLAGQLEQVVGTGQRKSPSGQGNGQVRLDRAGHPGQVILTGQPGQVSLDSTVRTELPEHDSKDRTAGRLTQNS